MSLQKHINHNYSKCNNIYCYFNQDKKKTTLDSPIQIDNIGNALLCIDNVSNLTLIVDKLLLAVIFIGNVGTFIEIIKNGVNIGIEIS